MKIEEGIYFKHIRVLEEQIGMEKNVVGSNIKDIGILD